MLAGYMISLTCSYRNTTTTTGKPSVSTTGLHKDGGIRNVTLHLSLYIQLLQDSEAWKK